MTRVRNQTTGGILVRRLETANTILGRMKGLLGRSEFPAGEGLWIEPCASIHTFFMRFPIDVLFTSTDRRVLRTYRALPPFRITPWVPGARAVLELPAGTLLDSPSEAGDQLVLESAP
jgi:uncharacterized membrane protein (UPF0127 family)